MNKFFKRLALLLAVLMIVSMMPVQLFADNSVTGEEQSNGTGEASGNSNAVAKIGDTGYETLAEAIAAANGNGTVTLLTATTELIQALLDGQYGSIDGLTIELPAGDYGKLELGRATKYAGSKTEYFVGGFDSTATNYKAFTNADEIREYKGQSTWTPNCFYRRALNNVTIKAADNATVTIEKISADAGQIYGKADAPKYDYVLDVEIPDTNKSYWMALAWNNVTFEGINFKSSVNIESSSEKTLIDGLHFENCKFNSGYTALAAANDPNKASKGMGIRFVSWTKTTNNLRDLTVNKCTFEDCSEGVYTNPVYGVSVTNSSFNNINHNAVAIQDVDSAVNHGNVVISGNTFTNVSDRIIRFNNAGEDTTITITGNTSVNSGDSAGEIIKATTMPDSVKINMTSNTWGDVNGKTAVLGNGFKPTAATINASKYETLAEAIAAAQNGDTIYVSAGEYTTYGNTSPKKSLTFVGAGAGNTIWTIGDLSKNVGGEGNGDYSFDGCDTITFKNMTLKSNSDDYRGFIRVSNTIVENCTLEGKTAYWGYNTATFTGCTFNAPEGDYALWDYSTKTMTFDGCKFNISGKGVNVYVEAGNAGSEARKVEAKDCTINSTKANKAFLNIKNSTQAYEVTLSGDNKVNGLDANSTTGSSLYQVETTEVTETSGKTVKVQEKATDGTLTTVYEVKAASTAVAMVGGVEYASLADAIAAAKDGETVILLSDRKNFVTNTINANITIDLNGKTLSVGNNNPFFRTNGEVTIQNGTIDSQYACVIVNAYNKLTLKNVKITGVTDGNGKNLVNVCSNAEVTIDKDTVLTASGSNGAAVFIGQDADAKYTLNVYGKVLQESKSFAISGNGSYKGTTTINIYDGAEVKSASVAIYHPQAGVINVNGGLVEGYCAIGIKSGTLNINGGTVRGTADDHVLDDSNSTSGTITYDGSAIIVDSRSTGYAGNVNINVTGGTVESYYSTAIREIGEQDKPNMTQLTKLNITGGSVLGANQQLGNVTNDMLVRDISSSNVSVSGGTFNHAVPDSYCADGFIPTKNADGTYGVKEGKYVAQIGNVKYETLAEAVEAAKNGDTITLLEDCKSGRINLENKSVTVALNGKTLTSTAANGVMFCAKNGNKITIDGTVEGSKLVGTLMITAGTDGHIEVNGGTYESSLYCPIYVNGAVNSENSTVTVKNAIINATNSNSNQDMGCGVYLAGYSTSVFENCTITAPITGIEIRAGKLTLNNCDVTGGNGEVKTKANGNGTTVTNAALAISQHTTKKPIEVIINGGTFNGTAAVYQTDVQDTGSVDVKIAVKNGTFNGTISGETDGTIVISGGKFKFKVDDKYFADKLACSATPNADGYYTVKDHPIISAGISISEDMSFRIIVGKGYENGKLKYYYDTIGEDNTIVRVEGEGILGTDTKGNSIFRIYNVNPQRADLIYVIQYYDADGNAVGAPKEISVLTYFEGFYNMEAGKNEDVDARKTFIANFLEYCASAMERSYTQYEDVKLNGKTWQDRADAVRAMMTRLGLEATDYEFKGNLGRYFKDNSEGIILKRGVVFGSTFKAYYQISKEAIDNGYKVFRQGMDVTDKLELVDGAYRLYFELAPYEFKDNLTITVYNGTTKVCEYTSPLANTLEVLSKSTDASLANMAKAAFNYFVALQNYNG